MNNTGKFFSIIKLLCFLDKPNYKFCFLLQPQFFSQGINRVSEELFYKHLHCFTFSVRHFKFVLILYINASPAPFFPSFYRFQCVLMATWQPQTKLNPLTSHKNNVDQSVSATGANVYVKSNITELSFSPTPKNCYCACHTIKNNILSPKQTDLNNHLKTLLSSYVIHVNLLIIIVFISSENVPMLIAGGFVNLQQ